MKRPLPVKKEGRLGEQGSVHLAIFSRFTDAQRIMGREKKVKRRLLRMVVRNLSDDRRQATDRHLFYPPSPANAILVAQKTLSPFILPMPAQSAPKKLPRVLCIGAGEIGRAVSHLLSQRGINADLWDADPARVPGERPLTVSLPEADIVFLCVPSWVLRDVIKNLRATGLRREAVIVALSKGLEQKTLLGVDEVLAAALPRGQRFALLAGPMLAEEIVQDLQAAAVVASRDKSARETVKSLFRGTGLRVETSADVHGVALSSVIKNVFAVTLGIADGLGWGGNRKGWLAARAIAEMEEVLGALHAQPRTVRTAAGWADLISTGFSRYSRNHQVGDDIVHTGTITVKSEGVVALPSLLKKLGPARAKRFPLLRALAAVMRHRPPQVIFERYFHESQ